MNKTEALALLEAHLSSWRSRPYSELASLIGSQACSELVGASGAAYQVEVEAFWDAASGGNIRVLAAIDDGGVKALKPLTADFIMAPDGRFVGEGL
jgi:hypothetical protein